MQNVSVNRSLPDKAMDRIDHALGRPAFPLGKTYRNYYAANSADTEGFVDSPNWVLGQKGNVLSFWHVTKDGIEALVEYLKATPGLPKLYEISYRGYPMIIPAKSLAQARYLRYLELRDAYDIPFIEYVRDAHGRRI